MRRRKQHAGDAGYIAERMNPHAQGHKVVIYESSPAGLDVGGDRYAVVCDMHSELSGATSVVQARGMMKAPTGFCEGCQRLAMTGPASWALHLEALQDAVLFVQLSTGGGCGGVFSDRALVNGEPDAEVIAGRALLALDQVTR